MAKPIQATTFFGSRQPPADPRHCPECGCNRTLLLRKDQLTEIFVCDHCSHRFELTIERADDAEAATKPPRSMLSRLANKFFNTPDE